MRFSLFIIFSLFLLSCGTENKKETELTEATRGVAQLTDGTLNLSEKTLLVTYKKATKDQELVNTIDPGDVSKVKVIKQVFRFKTTEDSILYLSDENFFGLCTVDSETGRYPKPKWSVTNEKGDVTQVIPRVRVKLNSKTFYRLHFELSLDCAGTSFESNFTARLLENLNL